MQYASELLIPPAFCMICKGYIGMACFSHPKMHCQTLLLSESSNRVTVMTGTVSAVSARSTGLDLEDDQKFSRFPQIKKVSS